jgi:hypothetical protein
MFTSTHLKTERDPVSGRVCFLVFWIPIRWTKSRNPVVLRIISAWAKFHFRILCQSHVKIIMRTGTGQFRGVLTVHLQISATIFIRTWVYISLTRVPRKSVLSLRCRFMVSAETNQPWNDWQVNAFRFVVILVSLLSFYFLSCHVHVRPPADKSLPINHFKCQAIMESLSRTVFLVVINSSFTSLKWLIIH